ncbi:MAG: Rieske 2Fe-2S domain-containing protein [Pseudomonadales bacterium]|nr:Rieske 2Fe-2S domain-containing protein [Pseudomonadales bacterium]
MKKVRLLKWDELTPRTPKKAMVEDVDLMVIRYGDEVSVLYGRCLHRGVLLANGTIVGKKIICGWHGWEFRYDTGASGQRCPNLQKFDSWLEEGYLWVDADQIRTWKEENPQPYIAAAAP